MKKPVVERKRGPVGEGEIQFEWISARLDPILIDKARRIGNGNVSQGIREALAAYVLENPKQQEAA